MERHVIEQPSAPHFSPDAMVLGLVNFVRDFKSGIRTYFDGRLVLVLCVLFHGKYAPLVIAIGDDSEYLFKGDSIDFVEKHLEIVMGDIECFNPLIDDLYVFDFRGDGQVVPFLYFLDMVL